MTPKITKTQRWLDLITYLVGRRLPVAVDEIMERVPAYADKWLGGSETNRATARRTFERDKVELRKMGIPLETVTYTLHFGAEMAEGYRISRNDFYMPYLRLLKEGQRSDTRPSTGSSPAREIVIREEEATFSLEALRYVSDIPDFPLRDEAKSALRKLGFDLDGEIVEPVPAIQGARRGSAIEPTIMRQLSEAMLARKKLRIVYHGIRRDEISEREVSPYGLFFKGDWYLVGLDVSRQEIRVFRVSRVQGVEMDSDVDPEFEVPPTFEIENYLERESWELGDEKDDTIEADVFFRFPHSLWASRNGFGEARAVYADGSASHRFRVRQVDPFIRWVLGMAGEAEIVEPVELRHAFLERLERVVAIHRENEGHHG